MSEQSCHAKEYYDGEEAMRYDEKRLAKPKWQKEQTMVRRFLETLPGGANVLDWPVATGCFLHLYSELGLKATCADVSPGLIEEAEGAARAVGADFAFEVANAEKLSFADQTFDARVGHRSIKWLPSD